MHKRGLSSLYNQNKFLFHSLMAIILTTISHTNASLINSQPQFAIKAEKDKACGKSCLFATFNISSGNIADCLGRCLENCRCKSFQICQNSKCQLSSSHKVENSLLLHYKDGCIYVTYEMTNWTETFQVRDQSSSNMTSHMNSHISIDRFHGSHVKFGFHVKNSNFT